MKRIALFGFLCFALATGFGCKVKDKGPVKRVVMCAGKVFYDMNEARGEPDGFEVALVRVEQLYPFPLELLIEVLDRYPNATELVWCQEEPQNQGAWYQIRHQLQKTLKSNQQLFYAGRHASSSPATGYFQVHVQEQKALVETALTPGAGELQRAHRPENLE